MKIHLAEMTSRKDVMNLYLAGEQDIKNGKGCLSWKDLNILESFFYANNNKEIPRLIQNVKNFLLDSGAFSFLQNKGGSVDFNRYIEEYAEFINKYDVKLFFELDIDSIIGLDKIEVLRDRLESLTGKKPIPVWHKNRGKQYFIDMCKSFPYVAIGGIVTQEIPRKKYEAAFPWFIKTAHENGAKIHGLGYTCVAKLRTYHFDSVDSASWLYGNRGGYVYKFNPTTGLMEQIRKEGCRVKTKMTVQNNFNEWVKFSKYAEKYY